MPDDLPSKIPKIISYLNKKTGVNFKPDTYQTQTLIFQRFQDGFSVEDFFAVIDIKTAQWLPRKEMRGNLRPVTLFGDKFESYLQEANRARSQSGNMDISDTHRHNLEAFRQAEEMLNGKS